MTPCHIQYKTVLRDRMIGARQTLATTLNVIHTENITSTTFQLLHIKAAVLPYGSEQLHSGTTLKGKLRLDSVYTSHRFKHYGGHIPFANI